MLGLALLLALTTQDDPQARQPLPREAVAVVGTIELTEPAALDAALRVAREALTVRQREEAGRVLSEVAPRWLPSFVRDRVLERAAARASRDDTLRILDRQDRIRDHGFGPSYQTTLWIAPVEGAGADLRRSIARDARTETKEFLAKCACIVALWGVLLVGVGWFDRLTRGYMTGRLRLLGGAVGLVAPTLLLLS
ncbi:MAG: hypothetical protein IT458_10760 [Planctomycetes bacterium]|nr:hypothetical protein [Planctomycetota bacterium]